MFNNEEKTNIKPLKLTICDIGKELLFYQDRVTVGRNLSCDLFFDNSNKKISRHHATFFFENEQWFIIDENSLNGVWLNETKIQSGTKYPLSSNDIINLAYSEKLIFDTQKVANTNYRKLNLTDDEKNLLAALEKGIDKYEKNAQTEKNIPYAILFLLANSPLYLPVVIDKSAKFYPGDKDSKAYFLKIRDSVTKIEKTVLENNIEAIPVFTSQSEADKGKYASVIQYYSDEIFSLIKDCKMPIVINPFGNSRLLIEDPFQIALLCSMSISRKKKTMD